MGYINSGKGRAFLTRHSARALFLPALLAASPLYFPVRAGAVPAEPDLVDLPQSDGSKVKVALKGDEFYSWNEDENGYTIDKDTATNDWVYSEKDAKGKLKKGRHKVGKADPSRLGYRKHQLDDEGVANARRMRNERDSSPRPSFAPMPTTSPSSPSSVSVSGDQPANTDTLQPADGPQYTLITQGTMKNLVILARFSDQTNNYSQVQLDAVFNTVGYTVDGAIGSVRDYYTQVSYGKLTMQSTVTQWVTLPNTMAYYGTDTPSRDYRVREMVTDAINALDTAGFDFTTVDGNADGEVDGLTIIHSGRGQEASGNSTDYIWSHKWQLATPVYKDGIKMQMYHTEPEQRGWDSTPATWGITRIGVIAHETAHFLGLPDLYDYGGDSKGAGNFCLMAGGSWNATPGQSGNAPAQINAYGKARLGWSTPTVLSAAGNYSLARVEDSDTAMYKFKGASFASTEYFLMENKQAYGFDAYLPGTTRGLLIWHVDEAISDTGANDNQLHYKVDLEEASGTQDLEANTNSGDDADYFRNTTMATFGDSTTPNSKSYSGQNLLWYVQSIPASANPMVFNFGATDSTPPPAVAAVYDGAIVGEDMEYNDSTSQTVANWPATSDPESGILRYWYAMGTTPGGTDVIGWTNNGTGLYFYRDDLSLVHGAMYYISVKAENYQGLMSNVTTSNGQRVDITPPNDPGAVSDGTGADIGYSTSTTQLSANWGAATDPESGIVEYEYAIGTTAGSNDVIDWSTNGVNTSTTVTGLSLLQNQMYYFSVRAYNGLYYVSGEVSSNGQRVDATAPSAPVAVNDGTGADAGYTSSVSQLSANWPACADAESGIVKYWYAIGTTPGGTDVAAWTDNGTNTTVTKTGLTLADGQAYYFTVKSENGSGLQSAAVQSNGQVVDTSAPAAPVLVSDGIGSDSVYAPYATQLSANWAPSSDPHSGIAHYWYAIGTSLGGTEVVNWSDVGVSTYVTRTGLSLTQGQTYYFSVKAENGAGLQSGATNSNGAQVDATSPTSPGPVQDGTGADVTYAPSDTQLSANWSVSSDADSGVARYWYAIGTSPGNIDVAGWTDNGLATSVTRTGLSLANGQPYYFTVIAQNGAGLPTAPVNSNGQTVDVTPPTTIPAVNDGAGADIAKTGAINQLAANWSAATDPQSGIAHYFYAIGTSAGGVDVAGWTDNGTTPSVLRGGLSLTSGVTYYFTVKAENGAGQQTGVTNSNGQYVDVDVTPPANVPQVRDGLGADTAWNGSLTQLSANWSAASDAQSGIGRYWYAIGTSAGGTDISGWTDNGLSLSVTHTGLSLTNGQAYFFSVKAENGAGLLSGAVNSNGQTVDVTPPSTPGAVSDGLGADVVYVNSSSQLSANWTASSDAQSGVAKYWYAIGTSAGGTEVQGWTDNGLNLSVTQTGLGLADGTVYYFSVKAENGGGLQSGVVSTDGQMADASAPASPASVDDGAGADAAYTTSLTQLSANWPAASDPHSGVVKYWYAIGTTPGGTSVANWTDNGLSLSVTRAGLSLANGQVYYFSVKAENGAGGQSSVRSSNGQIADNTPPSAASSVKDGTGSDITWTNSLTQLSANWVGAADAQSGVAKYWYAVGTSAGASDVVAWTDNSSALSVTRTGLTLADGTIYYFSVKAENGAGLQSAAASSNGQRPDSTPPAAPGVVRDGAGADTAWAGYLSQLSANWDAATDALSGVVKYRYAIGTTPGATNVLGWTDNGLATSANPTGLSLSNGQIYYFSVTAENGAGLQSLAANSNGQTVDATPPTNPAPVNDGTGADVYYIATTTFLSANWAGSSDPESGVARYRYKIGTFAGSGDVADWTDNGLVTSVTKTGLTLVNGQVYYFTVRAENAAGMPSTAVSSNGQMVEVTSPTAPSPVRDGAVTGVDVNYVNSLTALSANWGAASDLETAVAKYYYAIGTTAGGTDVLAWTDNSTALSATKTGLSLTNGVTYYFTVKAENGAGMQSLTGNSDGQTTDITVPSTAAVTVNDGIGADISETGALNRLAANWTPASDPQSGIARYWYAIGTTQGGTEVVGWTDVGLSTYAVKTGLVLANHQAYYFSVKADNGAGLQSLAANSNGQTTNKDTTPPTDVPQVRDGPAADIAWAPSATQLTANWDESSDAESGIGAYFYAIGTTPGANDVLNWTENGLSKSATAYGLSLTNGQAYYFAVMSLNGSGFYSVGITLSNGQRVDATAPVAPARVNDGAGSDAAYTGSLTQLSANWPAASDPESGVTGYLYAAGTSPGGTDVIPWTANGLTTSVTRTGLSLVNGQAYYFSVKAVNAAGTESTVAVSDGQTADNTPPSAPTFVYDGTGADVAYSTVSYRMSANWGGAADAQSGVARYYYSIGTAAGAGDVLSWTDNGVSTGVVRSGLVLSDGITYYFNVKAVNGSGLESGVASSNGQKIDLNPASDVSPVTDGTGADISYVPSLTTLSARWNASVHSSGIAAYFYGIGTTPGAIDLVGWTNNGLATSVTKTGLTLAQGQIYYFTVKARTNQGTESAPGVSDGQRVDTLAPTAAVELTPASPLRSGAFTVRLTVTEAGAIASGPVLGYQPASGPARTLQLAQSSPGVWTASGFIDSLVSSGTAVFVFSATDGAGNSGASITSGGSFAVDTSMSPSVGGSVRNGDGTEVTVPAGAASSPLWVDISTPSAAETAAADARTYDSVPIRAADLSREFTARDPSGTEVTNFAHPVTIRLTWPDANNDGRVDGDYMREALLRLYYLEPATDKWVPVEGGRRDLALNYIEAEVSHFSVYGIRAISAGDQEMGSIKAYPNPCYMADGALRISGIPVDSANPKVQIFNVAGELVRTLKPGDGLDSFNLAAWDGKLSSGAKAASGLYIYLVKTGNHGTATGKFAILW
jgi:M6 family metalloprotease-like protein